MGETSGENSSEKSAAKFLSNGEADSCCRRKEKRQPVFLSPFLDFSEQNLGEQHPL